MASLTANGIEDIPAKILDISTGGAAVFIQRPLPIVTFLKLSFALPKQKCPITTACELAWKDVRGNLGIQFLNPDLDFALSLSRWMKAQSVASGTVRNS